MIALDTNVIVRFLVRDDEKQANLVYQRLKKAEADRERLFIPLPVMLETLWVLESAYGKSRSDILDALHAMSEISVFEFEKAPVIEALISEGRHQKADLSDILIAQAAASCGCETVLTFDKKAAKLSHFDLLK